MSIGNDQAPLISQEKVQEVSDQVFNANAHATQPRSNNSAPCMRPYKIGAAVLGLCLAVCACIREAHLGIQNLPGDASARGVDVSLKSEVFHVFSPPKSKNLADADAELQKQFHTFQPPTKPPPQVHTFQLPHAAVHSVVPKQAIHTFSTPVHTFNTATAAPAPPIHTFSQPAVPAPPIHTFSPPAKPKVSSAPVKARLFSIPTKPKADNPVTKEGAHNQNKKLPWWKKNSRPGEAWPSLFCWMHMELSELKLVLSQLKGKFGIFNCNDFAVVTREDKAIELGPHPKKANKTVMTWPNPMAPDVRGNPKLGDQTDSWKNAETFKVAWQTLINSGAMWKHDWIVKIDPDTVFFPDRLRYHVVNKTMPPEGPGHFFFLNCLFGGGRLYGAIEVFSVRAILNFKANGSKCDDLDAAGMGEDLFMEQCMRILQGSHSAVKDFKLVGDSHCTKATCEDSWRVGFHPYPKVEEYWDCANTAVKAARAQGM